MRYGWCDQHGLIRSKVLLGKRALTALDEGVPMVGTLLIKDPTGHSTRPVFSPGAGFDSPDFEGASNVVMVPDPLTCHDLSWSPGSAWVQCEAYFPDGRAVPFDTRAQLRRAIAAAHSQGVVMRVGLEVEFHIFRIEDTALSTDDAGWPGSPTTVSLLGKGYRLAVEQCYDEIEPVLELLRKPLLALGLPLESIEIELGPSQVEFVFGVLEASAAADAMVLFRHATKQILRRHGFLATFMCRPDLPNLMSSGWHLHQSLADADTGRNRFTPSGRDTAPMSSDGMSYLAGLLGHARANTAFSTPTINGYRRFRPDSLAPDRICWGRDNRGVLVRVVGGHDDPATRIEYRGGEPAANPYLYLASQLHTGLHGMAIASQPCAASDRPYDTGLPAMPRTLDDALAALETDSVLREAFGNDFIDYYLHLKRFELARCHQEVSAWEQREYFDLY